MIFGEFNVDGFDLFLEIGCSVNNNDYFCYMAVGRATYLTEIHLGAHTLFFFF